MDQVDSLVDHARRTLMLDPASPEFLSSLERYAELFDAWLGSMAEDDLPAVLSTPQGTTLAALHTEMLEQAEKVKGEVRGALKGLRKKGKGILAYTDTMPKRLSVTKPRKG